MRVPRTCSVRLLIVRGEIDESNATLISHLPESHTGLSDDFRKRLATIVELHDVNGVELYCSAAISKCFHLTADLHIIEPAEVAKDVAVVFGLRASVVP